MFRKLCLFVISSVAFFGVILPSTSFAASPGTVPVNNTTQQYLPQTLTQQQIHERMIKIDQKYKVGQALDPEDAAFVEEHSNVSSGKFSPNNMLTGHLYYDKGKSAYGFTVHVSGSAYVNGWNPFNDYASCNLHGHTTHGSVTVFFDHSAYGMLGSKVVGKIYSRRFSYHHSSHDAYLDTSAHYAGAVVYSLSYAGATGYYNGHSLTVTEW